MITFFLKMIKKCFPIVSEKYDVQQKKTIFKDDIKCVLIVYKNMMYNKTNYIHTHSKKHSGNENAALE